jgi:hypothetical protein
MHGIRTKISQIFCYHEIASQTKFGGLLLQHGEEKSAKSLTVVNTYIYCRPETKFGNGQKFAAAKLQIFAIRKTVNT